MFISCIAEKRIGKSEASPYFCTPRLRSLSKANGKLTNVQFEYTLLIWIRLGSLGEPGDCPVRRSSAGWHTSSHLNSWDTSWYSPFISWNIMKRVSTADVELFVNNGLRQQNINFAEIEMNGLIRKDSSLLLLWRHGPLAFVLACSAIYLAAISPRWQDKPRERATTSDQQPPQHKRRASG
jgi:hypothetical protein